MLNLLATHTKELQALGVQSLAVFGLVVHEEAGPDSNVDVLVEFTKPVGFFEFVEVKGHLRRPLGCPVDLVTRKALHPQLQDKIANEAVCAR